MWVSIVEEFGHDVADFFSQLTGLGKIVEIPVYEG
jgi:hypothetical protein